MMVNFVEDLPLIREYIAERVHAQSQIEQPISAIEVGFQLCQAGILVLNFDLREKHDRDGEWTRALDGPVLELPQWWEAYESAEEHGIEFILPTGESCRLPPAAGDEMVAGKFGEALLSIALDAIAKHTFDSLNLREDCQLDIEEFDGMWAWPLSYEEVGRTNMIRNLAAVRLPG